MESLIEATEHLEDKLAVGEGVAEVTQLVGVLLQLAEVGENRHVALDQRAQCEADVDGLHLHVVEEQPANSSPNGRSSRSRHDDEPKDLR